MKINTEVVKLCCCCFKAKDEETKDKRLKSVKNIIPTWPWSAQILARSHCGKRCQSEHQRRAACPGWTPAGAWNSQIYPVLSLGADNCNRKDYPCLPDIKRTHALKYQMLWSSKAKENVPDQSSGLPMKIQNTLLLNTVLICCGKSTLSHLREERANARVEIYPVLR